MTINEVIKLNASKGRRRIGISILDEDGSIDSLKKAQDYADIVIYSNHEINGFETKIFDIEDEIGRNLVRDYKSGEIDQFVRGQVDDLSLVEEFKQQFEIPNNIKRITFALLEDIHNRQFFLCIASNPEGQTYDDKKRIVDSICEWMQSSFSLAPKVAIMATCRPGSIGNDPLMTRSFEEAEVLVSFLRSKNVEAKNIHIELESSLPWANLVAASNGTIGNQIFRALVYLGGWKNLLTPSIFPGYGMYEDNSRNETDWFPHILFASAAANMLK